MKNSKSKDPDSFINTMKERFHPPIPLALERGAMANVKSDKKDSYMTPQISRMHADFEPAEVSQARLV